MEQQTHPCIQASQEGQPQKMHAQHPKQKRGSATCHISTAQLVQTSLLKPAAAKSQRLGCKSMSWLDLIHQVLLLAAKDLSLGFLSCYHQVVVSSRQCIKEGH